MQDRLLHHAIYRKLSPFFDRTFIADSYSCRKFKGTHRAIQAFRKHAAKASLNNTKTLWVLKCDIKKFFASVDHVTLLRILDERIPDKKILHLLSEVIGSFHSGRKGVGLPLGNLTSQLLVNVYMNEFDQFAKHVLKVKHYVRYADDFTFLSRDREWIENLLPRIREFLWGRLYLKLHPDKVFIKTFASGIDFLGWVNFPDHKVLRTTTKRRILRNVRTGRGKVEALKSYLGFLQHGNTHMLSEEMKHIANAHIPGS